MNLPNLRLIFLSIVLLAAQLQSATVSITVNSNGGPVYAESNGTLLSFGSAVRVGYFDLSSPSVVNTLQTSDLYAVVNALFTPLAESVTDAGTVLQAGNLGQQLIINDSFGSTGHLFGQVENIESTYLAKDARLSVWVFNNADPSLATEWGIFSAVSGWEFPAALGSQTLATFEITNAATEVVRGSYDGGSQQLRLDAISNVPEPGSLTLLVIAGFVAQRRRRGPRPAMS